MILQPEPAILNLGINQQTPVAIVATKITQSLLRYDFDLSPMPSLAKAWEVSPDGLTYTFHLHDNVFWHDGEKFSADDVLFNVQDFLPAVHSRARLNYEHVQSVTAPDPNTVVFRLKGPFAPFLKTFEINTAPLFPKHLYAGTNYQSNPYNLKPVGTGPFKFAEWSRGDFIRLVRNDKYYIEGKPYLDQIVLRMIPDAQSRLIAVQNQQVDVASWIDVDYVSVPVLAKDPNVVVGNKGYEFQSPIAWLEINNRVKPFDDKRVRKAVLTALDRDFIVRVIFANQCKVASGPIASTTPGFDPTVPKIVYDPKAAEALLDDAGLKRGADGVRFRTKLLPLPYGETWQRLAEYCRQALEKVGIAITMESSDAGGWAQRVSNWDYELTVNSLSQLRRSRAWRVPQLCFVQHPQGRLRHQQRGLREPARRCVVRLGRHRGGRREAQRDVCGATAHPDRRSAGGLDRGNEIPNRDQQARARRRHLGRRHRGQFPGRVGIRLRQVNRQGQGFALDPPKAEGLWKPNSGRREGPSHGLLLRSAIMKVQGLGRWRGPGQSPALTFTPAACPPTAPPPRTRRPPAARQDRRTGGRRSANRPAIPRQ